MRELVDRELIQVGVGNADVRDFRADVGDFDDEVRGELALQRRIPLLHIAGAEVAIHGEDPLAEAGVGVSGIGSTLGPSRA